MEQGGHYDAAEVLHKELTYLFEALGVDVNEVIIDMELWAHFVKENSTDQLLTFMRSEFGRGYLAAIALASLDDTTTAAMQDAEDNDESEATEKDPDGY